MTELSVNDEFYFQWHLTERCNRACKHCYQNGNPAKELPLGDLQTIVGLMEEAVKTWGKLGTISLTGGEPFIRRDDLHAVMDQIDRSDNLIYYDILTNGSLITETEADTLKAHKKLRRVQVSLEGATAESNDAIRGPGSFDLTIMAIRRLRTAGIDVSVMTTVSRANKDEIPMLVALLGSEGVTTFALERLIPEGSGAGLSDLVLSPLELEEVYKGAYQIAMNQPPVRLLLYRPLFALLAPEDTTVGALCSAGNNALTIMPDGTVLPCRRLPIPIGNLLKDGFYKIWYGSEVLWRIRNPQSLNAKCRDCTLLTQCRGCRAMAFSMTGDYMAEDPQCWR
jgi:radical SAM protein with 4Fe4S-binding SPASM domain